MRVAGRYLTLITLVLSFVLPYTALTNSATPALAATANALSVPTSSSIVAHVFHQCDGTGGCSKTTVDPQGTELFSQVLPTIDFNPNAGVNPCGNVEMDETHPFTNVVPAMNGNPCRYVPLAGNGYEAGCGFSATGNTTFTCTGYSGPDLGDFVVEATTNIIVPAAGTYTLNFESDDSSFFGVGSPSGTSYQATLVSGTKSGVPATTLHDSLPVTAGNNNPQGPTTAVYQISFPAAGCYPFEIDYMEIDAGQLSLTFGNGSAGAPLQQLSLTTANTNNTYSEGQNLNGSTIATFTSTTDGGNNASVYTASATVNGSPITASIQWDSVNSQYDVVAASDYTFPQEATNVPINVTVNCLCGSTFQTSGSDTVSESQPVAGTSTTVAATEGSTVPANTIWARFTDASDEAASEYSVANPTYPFGSAYQPSSDPGFTVVKTGTGQYAIENSNPTVFPDENAGGTMGFTVSEDNAVLNLTNTQVSVADAALTNGAGNSVTFLTGTTSQSTVLGSFQDVSSCDAEGESVSTHYSASIDWGDGTSSSGTVAEEGTTCVFTVSGQHKYTAYGIYPIKVTASDEGGTTVTFTATGTAASGLNPVKQNQTFNVTEGGTVADTTVLATFHDIQSTCDASHYSGSITWGDGKSTSITADAGSSPYITASADGNACDFDVVAGHTYTEEGSGQIGITVTDTTSNFAGTFVDTFNAADAPLTASSSSPVFTGGASGTQTVATFTDAAGSGNCDLADYSATITWGDGGTSSGAITGSGCGPFTVKGTHTYTTQGNYTVHTAIADAGGSAASADDSVTIGSSGPLTVGSDHNTFSPAEGAALTGVTLGTFTDSNAADTASDFTANIQWGDGNSSSGTVTGSNGSFTVTGTHTYTEEGSYPIGVTVTTTAGAATQGTITLADTASALDAPIVGTGTAVASRTEGVAFANVQVASFTDTAGSGNCQSGDFSATISWGDGSTSPGTVGSSDCSLTVSGAHTYAEEGKYAVSVTIDDQGGATASAATSIAVVDGNTLTVRSNIGTLPPATEGESLPAGQLVGSFTDSYIADSITGYSATIIINGTDCSYTLAGTIVAFSSGSAGIDTASDLPACLFSEEGSTTSYTVLVSDEGGSSVTSPLNHFKVVDAPITPLSGASFSAQSNKAVSGQLLGTFHDADASCDVGDYTATVNWGDGGSSSGTVVQSADGNGCDFDITGGHTYANPGTYNVTVAVSDAGGSATQVTATANVSAGLNAITQGKTLSVTEGGSVGGSAVLGTFQDPNPGCALANYSATIDWGDGSAADAAQIVADGACKFDIEAPATGHTYKEEGAGQVTLTVSDAATSDTLTMFDSFASADAPITGSGTAVAGQKEGLAFSGVQVATFTDTAPTATCQAEVTASDYSATIDWGDGSTSTGNLSGTACTQTVKGSHTYAEEGTYQVTATFADQGGATATASTSITVADDPNSLTVTASGTPAATEGESLGAGVKLGKFTDTYAADDPGAYTATITVSAGACGSATTVAGTITNQGGGVYSVATSSVIPACAFSEEGSGTTYKITVTDGATSKTATNGTFTVADAPLNSVNGASFTAQPNKAIASTQVLGTFHDGDTGCDSGDYTASVDWGDGNSSSGTVVASADANACDFDVQGGHTYSKPGNYNVVVTVTDAGGSATQIAAAVLVSAGLQPITQGKTFTVTEGGSVSSGTSLATFQDANPGCAVGNYKATIDWGDGSSATGTVVADSACKFDVQSSADHTYAEEGTGQVTITVTDTVTGDMLVLTDRYSALDAALNGTGLNGTLAATEGAALSAATTGTFSDANPTCVVGDFTATIAWGDGSTSNGTVVATGTGPCKFKVTGSHTYAEEGTYSLQTTVADAGGSTTSGTDTVTVADAGLSDITDSGSYDNLNGLTFVEGQDTNTQAVLVFHDADPNCAAGDYTVRIDWGDNPGNSDAGQLAATGGVTPGACDFTASGHHAWAEAGTYDVQVRVTDHGTEVDRTDTVTVTDAPLTSVQPGLSSVTKDDPNSKELLGTFRDTNSSCPVSDFSVTGVSFGDGGTDTTETSIVPSKDGNPCDFDVVATHVYKTATDNGSPYTTSVTVADTDGAVVTVAGSTNVTVSDDPITLVTGNLQQNGTEGNAIGGTGTVVLGTFHDPDTCTTNDYTATINWGDGTATTSGTVTASADGKTCDFDVKGNHTYAEQGSYAISVTVHDPNTSTTGPSLTIPGAAAIADAPLSVSATQDPFTVTEGVALSGQFLGTFTDGNPNAPISDLTAVIDWGDGSTSTGTITADATAGFDVSGSHTYAEEDNNTGRYPVHVTVTDADGSTTTIDDSANVYDAQITKVKAQDFPTNGTLVEGQSFQSQYLGTFHDPDPNCEVGDFNVNINWGDGSNQSDLDNSTGAIALSSDGKACDFDVFGSHTYTEGGAYTVTVTAADAGQASGGKDTVAWTDAATISDAPLNAAPAGKIQGVEGSSNLALGQFTDTAGTCPDTGDYTISVDWGDGTTGTGTVTQTGPGSCVFNVSGTHTYSDEGTKPYHIVATITDVEGNTVSIEDYATIVDAPLSSARHDFTQTEGQAFTNQVLGTFTDSNAACENEIPQGGTDPEADAGHYSVTVDWGDGTAIDTSATLAASGCTFTVKGSHTYTEEKAQGYNAVVTVTDEGGATTTFTDTATVNDAALTPSDGVTLTGTESLNDPNPQTFTLGTFRDAAFTDATHTSCDINDFTTTIQWGDGSSSAATAANGLLTDNSSASGKTCDFQIAAPHVYTTENNTNFPVHIVIKDTGGSQAIIDDQINVGDAPLSTVASNDFGGTEGQAIASQFLGTFHDTDSNCTPGDYSVSIDWGDGSENTTGTWAASTHNAGGCNFDAYGAHTYAEEGTYTVTVTATDQSQSTTISDTATVADAALGSVRAGSFTQVEGAITPVPGAYLGTFSDSAGAGYCGVGDQANQNHVEEYGVSINWGDGAAAGNPDTISGFVVPSSDGQPCDFDVYGRHIYDEEGQYTTSFTVTDHTSQATVTSINGVANVQVNDAPLTQVANPQINAIEGQQISNYLTATFHDTAGDTRPADCPIADFTATIDWGDGTTPDAVSSTTGAGHNITAGTGACDFNVNGTHIYPEEGNFTATITVRDEGGAVVAIKDAVAVADAPLNQFGPAASFNSPVEAKAFTGQYLGAFQDTAFTDADHLFCDSADYSVSIDWGDGSPADTASGAIVKPSAHNDANAPCVFDVTGAHLYQEEGVYTVKATITDKGGAKVTLTATATVNDAALHTTSTQDFSAVEGNADNNQLLGRFHDDANPYCAANDFNLAPGSVSIDWGDGAANPDTATGYVVSLGNCDFNVFGTHTYLDTQTGGYSVTVTVADDGGQQTTIGDTATVTDAPLSPTQSLTLNQTEGTQFAQTVLGTFVDNVGASSCQVLGDYSAQINWGDGSSDSTSGSNLSIVKSSNGKACNFDLLGTHTYAEENASGYPITVTVNDVDGSTTQVFGTIKVSDASLAAGPATTFSATMGQAFAQRSLGAFTDADPGCAAGDYRATIAWGDGGSTTASANNGTIVTGGATCQFQVLGSHQYTGVGPYSYQITVTDNSATTTLTGTVSIGGAPLQAIQQNQPVNGTEGAALSSAYLGEFHDTNPSCQITTYSASIQWGTGGPTTTSTSGNAGILPATDGSCNFKVYGNGFTPAEEGSGTIIVTVSAGSQQVLLTDPITIADAAINASPTTLQTAVEGQAFASMSLGQFTDADPGCQVSDYTVSVEWGDGHTDTSAGNNVFVAKVSGCQFSVKGSHTYAEEKSTGYAVTVTVTDAGGSTSSTNDTVVVTDAALASVHTATIAAVEGAAFANQSLGQFSDADPGCPAAAYSVNIDWGDGSSSTGSVSSASGCTFNVLGGHTYAEENATGYAVKVTVTDAGGQSVVLNDTATVSDAPLSVVQPNNISLVDGQALNGQYLGTFNDADPNCDSGDYSASIAWGDGSTSQGQIIASKNATGACTFDVLGSHQYQKPVSSSYTITVVVTDAGGATAATITDNAAVGDAPLTAGQVPSFKAIEGQPFTRQLLGTFRDTASTCSISDYSATVDWGDGSATDPATGANGWIAPSTDGNACDFDILGNHTYTQEGTYTTSVVVNDTPGVSTTLTATKNVTVSDAPLTSTGQDFAATEGIQNANQVLGTFTDSDPGCKLSDFTVSIKWDDGVTTDTTSAQLKPNAANPCQIDIVASHMYAEEGTFKPTVTVTDGGSATTSFTDKVVVADAALTSTGTSFSAAEGQQGKDVLLGTFTDLNPTCDAKDFSLSIKWGDTQYADTTGGYFVLQHDCTFNVYGNHVFQEENTNGFPVAVTVTDVGGSTTTIADTATVSDAPLTSTGVSGISAVEGAQIKNVALGTFTDANRFCDITDMTATVTWGDGTTPDSGAITPNGTCTFAIAGTHTYGEEGTYTITVNVADLGGSSTSFTVPVTVTDAPFTSTPNPFGTTEGTSVTHQFLGTFVDTAGALYCDTADYGLSVTWGDGTAADLTAGFVPSTHSNAACAFDVYGSHTFTEEGTYGAKVTVTDRGGSTVTWSDSAQVTDAPLTGLSNLPGQTCWVLTTCGQPSVAPAASVGGLTNVQTLGAVAKFKDGNSQYCNQEGDPGTHYTATIDWGDNSTSTGTVQEEGTSCTFDVLGSHMYANPGTYTVSATVNDEGTQVLTTTTAAETTSTIVAGIPPNTAPVARTGGRSTINYKSGTAYLMQLTATHYANNIFTGTLSVTDKTSNLALSRCMVTTAKTAACKMTLLAYSATSSKAVTIFGSYQQGAKGVVRYFRLDLHDATPSVADAFTFLTTDATGHAIVTSTPPTAPNNTVTVVL